MLVLKPPEHVPWLVLGNEAGCAKAGKDFHMQARDGERGETGWKRCGAGFITCVENGTQLHAV